MELRSSTNTVMENNFKHTQSSGGVVLNGNGEVIVVSQRGTSWSLPKGQREEGEDMLTAAKREIYEEAGINDLEFIKEIGSYGRFGLIGGVENKSELKTITMFLFRTKENHLQPVDPENPEARWVQIEKVAELLTHPKDKEFFLGIVKEVQKFHEK